MRTRYARDKKKLEQAKTSGAGSSDVTKAQKKTSDPFHFLSWMDPYVKSRRTQSSYSAGSNSAMGSSEDDETDRSNTVSHSVLVSDRDDQSQLQTQNTQGLRDFASVSVRELDETKLSSATGSGRKKYSKKTRYCFSWQRVCQYQHKWGGGGGNWGLAGSEIWIVF